MQITCPYCGERDIREFSYRGAAVDMDRPAPDAGDEDTELMQVKFSLDRRLRPRWPGRMTWLRARPLAAQRLSTEIENPRAMSHRVSPRTTV